MKISANREDTEFSRIERLHILRLLIRYYDLGDKIRALHDHKGTLSVDWWSIPTDQERRKIANLWKSVFHEPNTDHFLFGYALSPHNETTRFAA